MNCLTTNKTKLLYWHISFIILLAKLIHHYVVSPSIWKSYSQGHNKKSFRCHHLLSSFFFPLLQALSIMDSLGFLLFYACLISPFFWVLTTYTKWRSIIQHLWVLGLGRSLVDRDCALCPWFQGWVIIKNKEWYLVGDRFFIPIQSPNLCSKQ